MKLNMRWTLLCALCGVACASCENHDVDAVPKDKSAFQRDTFPVINGKVDDGDLAAVGLFHPTSKTLTSDGTYSYIGNVYCTGTLIHKNWVLTAAHCVADSDDTKATPSSNNKDMMILVGTRNGGATLYDTAGADQIYWPSDYVSSSKGGRDIALIKLKSPMNESKVKPVLPHPKWLPINRDLMPLDMRIVGFGCDENGKYEVKKQASYVVMDYCGGYNKNDSASGCYEGIFPVRGCHPDPALCAKYGFFDTYNSVTANFGTFFSVVTDGIAACNGDSGGPSFYTIGGVEYVSSVTSWSDTPKKSYHVSTAVQDYYDWIIERAPEVGWQYKEICDNGVDDDGNGKIDSEDPACVFCGNGIVNVGEQCDKREFSGGKTTCAQWDRDMYAGGIVSCNADCTLNFDACQPIEFCGDKKLSADEECDGSLFIGGMTTCKELSSSYTGGTLRCKSDCTIDISDCKTASRCGDGIVSGAEQCDGTRFAGNRTSCNTLYPDVFSSGSLECKDDCTYDYGHCTSWCGNGSLNKKVGEVCDGDKFGGETCETLVGPGSTGWLRCTNYCTTIDTSECTKSPSCGNGVVDAGEACDLGEFRGGKTSCSDWDASYTKGNVSCNPNCTINYGLCEKGTICGNGILEDGEACDGTKFSGNRTSCKTLFPELYSGGTVKCKNDCLYDVSDCISWCGNGSINTTSGGVTIGEACDHSSTGDKFPTSANTCEKVVGKGSTGALLCASDCSEIIKSGCSEPAYCGDGRVNNTELCDGGEFSGDKTACADWDSKYLSGDVSCTEKCGLDFSECVIAPVCGDSIVNGFEECDGLNFKTDSVMCSHIDTKYVGGRITCSSNCKIDYSACRTTPGIPDEICTGGQDEDGDMLIDCEDPDCATDVICRSKAVCGDGHVNSFAEDCDGDEFMLGEDSCHEWMPIFKSGKVKCGPNCKVTFEECSMEDPEICDNKIDDNGNGRTDCDDVECINFPGCIADTDPNTEDCGNGKDDDGNGKIDCDDIACQTLPVCNPIEICNNNKDDDGNGKIDCEDPACAFFAACITPGMDEEPSMDVICTNGEDDNGNGKIDCDDIYCEDYPTCVAERESGKKSSSDCSAIPYRSPESVLLPWVLLGGSLLVRRRKYARSGRRMMTENR